MSTIKQVSPQQLSDWLAKGEAILVDVREPAEHAAARIAGASLVPLSSFDPRKLPQAAGRKLVIHCQSGARGRQACDQARCEVWNLEGGLRAWQAAGLPTVRDSSVPNPMRVQRQVFVVVGTMVLAGLALGVTVSPWWLLLALLPGAGLLNAGLTGLCPMAMLMAVMPWNKPRRTAAAA